MSATLTSKQSAVRVLPRAICEPWQYVVALFAVFSFALLLATAATHRHQSVLAEHECAICSAVADRIANLPFAPPTVLPVEVVAYFVLPVATPSVCHTRPVFLPPGRGPPCTSV